MPNKWKSLSFTTRFSIIACIITAVVGLGSMGLLGLTLYFPVSFLFFNNNSLDNMHGDWVWPATISIGMFWSLGFIFAGLVWHYLKRKTTSLLILRITYAFILWLWAATLWLITLHAN